MSDQDIVKQYSEEEMELFKNILANAVKKGTPKTFEMVVDGMTVVEKTNDLEEFDTHLDFIQAATKLVEVRVFYSPKSPKFKRYLFYFGTIPTVEKSSTLNGVEIQNQILQGIQAEREKWEKEKLREKLQEAEENEEELQEYIEKLQAEITQLRQHQTEQSAHKGYLELAGTLASAFGKGGKEGLAGLFGNDKNEKATPTPNVAESSFSEAQESISETDKQYLLFLKSLEGKFEFDNWDAAMRILHLLSKNQHQIPIVLDLLKQNNNQ